MAKVRNPFFIKGYTSPGYFCDREEETKKVISAVNNGRDITLYALRRMGKSGLLQHVGYYLEKKHDCVFLYTDIYNTESTAQLVEKLANSMITQLLDEEGLLKKIGKIFTGIRPAISVDEISGAPTLNFNYKDPKQAFNTLEEIFKVINSFPKKIVWGIDEFQQIDEYPKSERIAAHLRSFVQQSNNVNFIFSGSRKHILLSMFNDANKPFYQSTQLMPLFEIEQNKYSSFIKRHFQKSGFTISKEAIQAIFNGTLTHTWYVQILCNRLFSLQRDIVVEDVEDLLVQILKENEVNYYNYRQLLTQIQWSVLKAIAKEEKVRKPNSGEFIRKHNLSNHASVNRTLAKLLDDEFVVQIDEKEGSYYRLNNVFLMRWLQWLY